MIRLIINFDLYIKIKEICFIN